MTNLPDRQTHLSGSCACGQIEFSMTDTPLFVHCCHCTWCQRESGSAFAINALIESEHVLLIRGTPEATQTPSESGKGQVFVRCPNCKVALWSHYAGAGDTLCFVRAGTLNDPSQCPPDIHIYTRSKLPWVVLDDETPAVEAYYDARQLWPETSLRRRKAQKRATTG